MNTSKSLTLDEIPANAKAKLVETMNSTTVAPGSQEIELTHTGEFKDGDVVNVRIDNYAGHPLYVGTVKGHKLQIDREIPYKIDVGTKILLLSWSETKQAIVEAVEGLIPPEFEQPKRYLKEHTELQRATTKATVEGHNKCRAWMLQAIKEWQ